MRRPSGRLPGPDSITEGLCQNESTDPARLIQPIDLVGRSINLTIDGVAGDDPAGGGTRAGPAPRRRAPQARLHDLRHLAATEALRRGVQPHAVQERLAHSAITVTMGYTYVDDALRADAARRVGGHIRGGEWGAGVSVRPSSLTYICAGHSVASRYPDNRERS
jgi:hypothetical protein